MTTDIALLGALNVGGTGKLPMATLKAFCEEPGMTNVRTSIASGNVGFNSRLGEAKVKALLEARLAAYAGKPATGWPTRSCASRPRSAGRRAT